MQKLISWVELPSNDFEKAVKFYNSAFGLELEGKDYGSEKMACLPNDEGAIIFAENYKPSKDGAIVSFAAPDSVELTIERIPN